MNTVFWINKIMSEMYTNGTTQFWVGLSSSEPAADGSNVTEPAGSDYARVQLTAFSEPQDGYIYNVDNVEFAKSTTDWFPDSSAKAAYWVLFDGAGTDANVLSAGELEKSKTIESDVRVTLAAETLGITLLDYEAVLE